jgi:hypothetical protein
MVDFSSEYQMPNNEFLAMDQFVKLGGWDADYFNFVVANDDSSFWEWMFGVGDQAYNATGDAVKEIGERFESEERYRKEDPGGYVGETYDEIYEVVVDMYAKDFAENTVRRMEDDDIAAYWTAAGCYLFSEDGSPYWTREQDPQRPKWTSMNSSEPNDFDLDDDWYFGQNAISGLMAPFLLQFCHDMFFSMMKVRTRGDFREEYGSEVVF